MRPARVGGREHLLGRQVRQVTDPTSRHEIPASPARPGEQTDGELGAGAAELERVEATLAERGCGFLERGDPPLPGRLRIRLVEAQEMPDLAPEPFVGRLLPEFGKDETRPAAAGARDDRPVGQPLVDHRAELVEPGELVASEEHRVETFERERIDDAREGDPCVGPLGKRREPLDGPPRHVVERRRVGVSDPRALEPRVVVGDVYEACAAAVCRLGDRPDELLVADAGAHCNHLARLNVRSVDCQLAEGAESVVQGRRS